jgi:hypothetical protein
MPLSDTTIKNAKPASSAYEMTDGKGMHLYVTPPGGKLWRMQYRFEGKQKLLSIGAYSAVSLKEAHRHRDEKPEGCATNGIDPGAVKRAQKVAAQERAANSFGVVAARWFERWKTEVTENTALSQWGRLTKHIMPALGPFPVADIVAPKVLEALCSMEARGTGDTLRKSKMAISQIMDFAVQHGLPGQAQGWRGRDTASRYGGVNACQTI